MPPINGLKALKRDYGECDLHKRVFIIKGLSSLHILVLINQLPDPVSNTQCNALDIMGQFPTGNSAL